MVNIHATGVLLDGCGVAICGASGAGKSLLALELLDRFGRAAAPTKLVGDDRLELERRGDQVWMRPAPRLAGRIELRGRGIIECPFVAEAVLSLIVDLVDDLERMPEPDAFVAEWLGVGIARAPVPRRGVVDGGHQLLLVDAALRTLPRSDDGGEKIT